MRAESGVLYIVGTPLGNLEDISQRAVRILQEVDLIAAEDTRRTRNLLTALGIKTPMISYHRHNEKSRSELLVKKMQAGQSVALVSDGGMPGISDPGEALVQAAVAADLRVVPIPGPVAAVSALVISGLSTERFAFEGFLPRLGRARQERLKELAAEKRTMLVYEAPHRLLRTLTDLYQALGDRAAAVARELTKVHEECIRGTLRSLIEHFEENEPRGECAIVIAGLDSGTSVDSVTMTDEDIAALLRSRVQKGLTPSDAARAVAAETGWPRRRVYQISLSLFPGDR
ncbi:MAG: 16S rRNA (cytidine(1402)-2'-O)-methyltransferase [Firmicutes bacterium]|nr:16S rRNA (cytidine(1402)-2'-O)-methyltransferase [Bacillota bacterium]